MGLSLRRSGRGEQAGLASVSRATGVELALRCGMGCRKAEGASPRGSFVWVNAKVGGIASLDALEVLSVSFCWDEIA